MVDWLAIGVSWAIGASTPVVYHWLKYYATVSRPFRRFWGKLVTPSLSIVTSAEEAEPKIRSQIFDATAVADLEAFLKRLFPGKSRRYTCNESVIGMLNENVLLVGGPIANELTRDLFKKQTQLAYKFDGNDILNTATGTKTAPEFDGSDIVKDYGMITRCSNTFSEEKEALVVAGCYGWGTHAALNALLNSSYLKQLVKKKSPHFQVLVSVAVRKKLPVNPSLDLNSFVKIP